MVNGRKFGVACSVVIAAIIVACSATRPEDEDIGESALDLQQDGSDAPHDGADADDASTCRSVTLRAHHERGWHGEHDEDEIGEATLTPPMAFALPGSIALLEHDAHARHVVELGFDMPRPGKHDQVVLCLYASGPVFPASAATLLFCTDGAHAGDIVTAHHVELGVELDGEATATVTLEEHGPCAGADAGVDAGRDGGAPDASGDAAHDSGVDAALDAGHDAGGLDAGGDADAGPACTPATCNDDNPCTTDTCTAQGCTHTSSAAGASCSDGNACNGLEICDGLGACKAGAPPVCNSGTPCVIDGCSSASGCTQTPAPSGTTCADANACNGGEVCNGAGACLPGTPPVVDDANPCTVDSCDPVLGVRHVPVAPGSSCSNGNACDGVELCNATGACLPGVPPAVDDGNACTADACDPILGVVHAPIGVGASCTDGDTCNGSETCDGAGHCAPGTPLVVDDANPCTVDSCDPALGVGHTPAAAGTSCADANACNGAEACDATGACQPGMPPSIDDNNACTADSCNPLTGPTHTPIPSCVLLPVQGSNPFEPRASIMGRLVTRSGGAVSGASFTVREAPAPDGSGVVRGDVSTATGGDGSFRLRLTSFPDAEPERTPPLHVVVRVDAPGVLPVFRDAWVHTGSAVDLGVVKMVPRDAAVTPIGPAGGTASDSGNLVQVVIPAGALASTINVVITPYMARDELSAPLPDATATMYGFSLEPSGTIFSAPVSVRIANSRSAPTTFPIPVGFYDEAHGRWEHLAQAPWDGARFVFPTSHFTIFDANAAKVASPAPSPTPGPPPDPDGPLCGGGGPGGGGPGGPGGGGPGPGSPSGPGGPGGPNDGGGDDGGDDDSAEGAVDTGSTCGLVGAGLGQNFRLPTYRVKNRNFGVDLSYQSGLAGSRSLGVSPTDYASVLHGQPVTVQGVRFELAALPRASFLSSAGPAQPGRCFGPVGGTTFGDEPPTALTLTRSLAGATTTESFLMGLVNNQVDFGGFIHVPMSSGSSTIPAGSGLYRSRMVLASDSRGSCLGPGQTFGVSDFNAPTTQTSLDDGPLGTIETPTLVSHRFTSPYGAGWAVSNVSRVYRQGDVAFRVSGRGVSERFAPRAHGKGFSSVTETQVMARDSHTGEVFSAHDSGSIDRVDPATGAMTTTLSGLAFNVPVHGLAVAYVGGTREFVVALADRLLEIDAGGAQRVLTTRTADPNNGQASVAAREDVVFYASTVSPSLFRISLSDPARAVTAASLATAGDVRFYPQATLSGVTFGDPRGLTFDVDGTLYLADRARNTVYAIRPDASGNVVAASMVEPVVGDGQGSYVSPVGERQPGVRFSVREPLGVSMTEDGFLFVATTAGITSYDPMAREAETLMLWGGLDELVVNPTHLRVSVLGLTSTSALSRSDIAGGARLVRFDIDRLSSQHEPTRTMLVLPTGELELTDTRRARVERFDLQGRLVERRWRTGEPLMTVAYVDATGDAIDTITDAVGGQTVFSYAGGKIQSITDPRGRVTQLSIDGAGDLASLTEPSNETYSFVYDAHHLTQKRSPRSDLTVYTYRPDGTLGTATKPEGALTVLNAALSNPPVFTATGKVEHQGSYTDGRGVLHAVSLNLRGGVESNTHVEDGVTRVDTVVYATNLAEIDHIDGYSLFPNLESMKNNRLFAVAQRFENDVQLGTTMDFDAHGRPIQERRGGFTGGNAVSRWLYDDSGWLLDDFHGPSSVGDRYERDAAGHVTRIFDFVEGGGGGETGRERRWTYRPDGLVATATEHGVTRTYAYDELPAALNEKNWLDTVGRSMAYTRDAYGNVASTNDGLTTTFATFDVQNRVLETRDALGNATTYGYANTGCGCTQADLVTSIHTPDLPAGIDWQMTYDGDGRLASVTDPYNFTESYRYETTGELKKVTDKLLRDTTWSHDQLGRVLAMVDTLGRSHANAYTVPAAGAWVGPTLMAGSGDATAPTTSLSAALRNGDYQIGHNAYQPAGAPPAISLYRDATFALGYTHYFDVANRLTKRSDRTGIAIDSAVIPPAGTGAFWDDSRSYNGNTSWPILAVQSSIGPLSIEASNLTQNFEFDLSTDLGFGNGSGDPLLREAYTRDAAGRPTVLQRSFDVAGTNLLVSSTYTYRPDGRLAQVVNPDGTHDFTYDARGFMLTQVVSGEGTYAYGYDALGRPNALTYPDGHSRSQIYDDLGRITSRCYEYSGPTTRCYTAQYDAVGNPLRMTDPDGADRFEYDALDRLKKVTREVGGVDVAVEDYDYNALGALKLNAGVALDHQRPRLDGAGLADAAVPATLGGQPVTLDAGGRVTSLRGTSFTWSKEGFLRQAQDPIPAVAETYGVDSAMRRFARLQGASTELYVYEGLDRVATLDAAGAVVDSYLFDGIDHSLRVRIDATNTTAYYELDLAGNVRGLRASGGASLGGYRYTAFGQTLEDTSSIDQPLRWKGRWFAALANGTYDVRARQWSPELGSFLEIDEFEKNNEKTTSWGWPSQNPIRFDDPDGRGGYSPYRDKAPLGPGPAWCISNTTLYTSLRRTCCALTCFNDNLVGGSKGIPRVLDSGGFSSCMEQCDPTRPDTEPKQCK